MKKMRYIIIAVIMVALCVFYYQYLDRHSADRERPPAAKSELEQLISRDLETDYPKSPRDVVDLYSQIVKILYGDQVDEDSAGALVNQMRQLFAQQLLDGNSIDKQSQALAMDIEQYRKSKKQVIAYSLTEVSQVEYQKVNGEKCAFLDAEYSLKEDADYGRITEEFVLVQDDQGLWKILGWRNPLEETSEDK